MNFLDLVRSRQSVRKYSSQQVLTSDIDLCLEAARLAPSASNSQPWRFIVVDDAVLRLKIAEATAKGVPFNNFVKQAPVLIVIIVERPAFFTRLAGKLKHKDFEWTDMGIAAEHFCLQATELGLGSCMIGWFDEKRIMELLNVPKTKRVGLVITLGYAPENYLLRKKIRKTISQNISYNSWKW
jgi:nitroreductase